MSNVQSWLVSRHEAGVKTLAVLFVGGGIRDAQSAETAWNAGADIVVVGNAAFENPDTIREIAEVFNKLNSTKVTMS